MKVISSRKHRIFIIVTLYKNNEVVKRYSSVFKSRILDFVQISSSAESNFDRGNCRIVYNAAKDLTNEFPFQTFETFRPALGVATELPLLKYIEQGGW